MPVMPPAPIVALVPLPKAAMNCMCAGVSRRAYPGGAETRGGNGDGPVEGHMPGNGGGRRQH
jgi:hypothetical protein